MGTRPVPQKPAGVKLAVSTLLCHAPLKVLVLFAAMLCSQHFLVCCMPLWQVARLVAKSLFSRQWDGTWAGRVSDGFLVEVVTPALVAPVHHKEGAGHAAVPGLRAYCLVSHSTGKHQQQQHVCPSVLMALPALCTPSPPPPLPLGWDILNLYVHVYAIQTSVPTRAPTIWSAGPIGYH